MLTDAEFIELLRTAKQADPGQQWGGALAFGRAVEDSVRRTCEVSSTQAIEYARLAERDACAKWYRERGRLLVEDDVADAMLKRDAP